MAKGKRQPRCIVIAGPNGADKTTFARRYLPQKARAIHFVNADLIAGGLSPLKPELAAIAAAPIVLRAEVLRRFVRGWDNFQNAYRLVADSWAVYDNSSKLPRLLKVER
jgi:predicted ABC-type ATPase